MNHELAVDFAVTCFVTSLLTGLWLLFVYLNNRTVERTGGERIEPHPWRSFISMFIVGIFLTALDFLRQ